MINDDFESEKENELKEVGNGITIDPVDPREYCLFDNAVFSRAGELKPYTFLSDLLEPFIGRMEFVSVKGQVSFNNGPDAYSPVLDLLGLGVRIVLGTEIQARGGFSPPRALAYMSNIVVPSIPKGAGLSSPRTGTSGLPLRWMLVVFCDFHPFEDDDRAVHRFTSKEDGSGRELGNGVSYIFVDCKSAHLDERQRRVIHDLKAKRVEDMSIQSFRDALCYAQRETNTVEERRRRIMSVEEYNQMLINEGKAERDAEHVKNMALRGLTESEIASLLGMSEEMVRAILTKTA